jgi:protein SCO1/2
VKRLFFVAAIALLAGCSAPKPLDVFGTVPHFTLTAQDGSAFQGDALRGHVWIADFIFTNCEGPCPRMSGKMQALQNQTPASVRLVSFSVDPTHDTPAALTAYAAKFHADPQRWTFLTGDLDVLRKLGRDSFHLQDIDGTLVHSTRFALIDQKGQIRGYYGIGTDDPVGNLKTDAARLEKGNS